MAPLVRMTLAQIRTQPSRLIAVTLAVVLGVGFAAATVVFTATSHRHELFTVSAAAASADVLVTPDGSDSGADSEAGVAPALPLITSMPSVAAAELQYQGWAEFTGPTARGSLELDTVPKAEQLRWFTLDKGNWPTGPDELVVDRPTAAGANLAIGDTITLTSGDAGPVGSVEPPATALRIVGIADTSASAMSGTGFRAYAAAETVHSLDHAASVQIAVVAAAGTDDDELAAAVALVVPDLGVVTGAAQAAADVDGLGGESAVLGAVLLTFALVALLVAGMVISNTFTIVVAGRRRQIALLRCVGATGEQVRRQVVVEAFLIGTVSTLLGTAVGIGVGLLAARLVGLDGGGPAFDPAMLAVCAASGLVVTVLAALVPARRAMRVAPLAALRPVDDGAVARRAGVVRAAVGAVLTLAGGAIMVAGVRGVVTGSPSVLVAAGGGAASALGLLVLSPFYLPPLLRLVGRPLVAGGVTGRLAATNAVRNPGRAAASASALMIGVGLIVMLQVGAASAEATMTRATGDRFPVPVAVTSDDGAALPAGLADQLGAVDGLEDVTALTGTTAASAELERLGSDIPVIGLTPAAAAIVIGGTADLTDDTVVVPPWAFGGGLERGDRVTLAVGSRTAEFVAVPGWLGQGGPGGRAAVITAAALAGLIGDRSAAPVAVWASVESGADLAELTGDLSAIVAPFPDLTSTGSAAEHAAVSSALGTVVTLAIGMLLVAVVIALVGIGNTIGLSVIERAGESALLRALGLSRAGLRRSLAVEAGLLAGVGAVVGAVVGIGYGWVGASAALNEAERHLTFAVPWLRIGVVVAVAVAAGVVASLLPGRRAAATPPVQALAAAAA